MVMKWPWGIPSSYGRVAGRIFEFSIFEPKFHDLHDLFFSFFFQIFRNDIFVCRISSFMFSEYLLNGE